jgi:hypothetical protein
LFKCIKCEAELNGDFGMITCQNCGEINFMDDGERAIDPFVSASSTSLAPPEEYDMDKGIEPVSEPEDPRIEEIAQFANDTSSSAPDGFLHYDVTVSGIDSKEIRSEVIANLSDKRLGSAFEDIEKKIVNGSIFLPRLTPIKASQVVKKLRYIDVQVTWVQKPLHTPG